MSASDLVTPQLGKELLEFAQSLVRIKSISGQEGAIIEFIRDKMTTLGFDEVRIDSMGNVLGRIGRGGKATLLDAHVDTVAVNDAEEWKIPPFSGEIVDGRLHGRGSVDMKSGAAAAIYSAAIAKKSGLADGKTIYVSCSVFEEDCDGENLKHMFKELDLKPDYVVICEPSGNQLTLGHKGKAQITVKTRGLSAHGSAPEKGINAIYEMAGIIQRVEKKNIELMNKEGPRSTLVMTRISSTAASLNAVPSECEAYLDRRMVPDETEGTLKEEMERLLRGKNATWEVQPIHRKSWTGMPIEYVPFHLAWKIDLEHALTRACRAAYAEAFGTQPAEYGFWDFSTNAVTPVRLGIPTIGFGPGESKLAHMRDESCDVDQILAACGFYARLIGKI